MRGIPPYLSLLKQAAAAWSNDRAASMGAALAFYSAFSRAPLLIIVIAVAGMIFGVDAARGAVSAQLGALLGPVGADALEKLLVAASTEGSGVVATVKFWAVGKEKKPRSWGFRLQASADGDSAGA